MSMYAELIKVIDSAARGQAVKLNLSIKSLTSIPREIRLLTNLVSLDLNTNQLTDLPQEIGQLTNLVSLDLNSNILKSLPPEIGELAKLSRLDLSYNKLTSLPPEIGQLTNLCVLDISYNKITSLPSEIGQLVNLNTLYIHSNQLTSLPREIEKLINLGVIDLRYNQLTNIPPEIGELINLNYLSLNSNQLTNLPSEIGKLIHLNTLCVNNNKLTELPPEIGQLINLGYLSLNSNQLTTLPPQIGKLVKLSTLVLNSNNLENLPSEVDRLTNLNVLSLNGNPLLSLPPEIREKDFKEVIGFYKQLEETDRIYEAKLLVIGEGGAGKTTLVNKIQSLDYQLKDENSTQGIDVTQWQFLLENGKKFCVNIWDFGGQEIYHTTHQFFLTKRSLYALVVDTRKEDTDFYYWLNIVELLSDRSPLLIIKNEKKERIREINEQQLKSEFTNLEKTLSTNLETNRGLPEIINQIKHYISNLPHVGTELPKTWVKVREALEQESRNYISLDKYLDLCENNGFTSHEDKLQLSGYLHDLGVCLHFQEDELLNKTVILKPNWGTDAVYKVLDNPLVIQNQGRFTRNQLKSIWHEDKYVTMQDELLRLMMNFKLCYEIPNSPKTYIAPQWLTPNQPNYTWDKSDNLLLRYKYEFMPKGILTRFIVEMHSWIEQQSCVWKSGIVLSKDGARAEVIELYRYHKGEIHIRVSGKRPRDLLTKIRHELEKIHNSYNSLNDKLNKVQRLKCTALVPCNCSINCKMSQDPYFYPLERLYKCLDAHEDIQCQVSFKMVSVHNLIDNSIFVKSRSSYYRESRSEQQQDSLQQEWDLANKKATNLRLACVNETDAARKFQLETQIKEVEKKLTELDDRLN
jgi:internalin A